MILFCLSLEFGRGADVRCPGVIRSRGLEHRQNNGECRPDPRALSAHFRAQIRVCKLRADCRRPPESLSFRELHTLPRMGSSSGTKAAHRVGATLRNGPCAAIASYTGIGDGLARLYNGHDVCTHMVTAGPLLEQRSETIIVAPPSGGANSTESGPTLVELRPSLASSNPISVQIGQVRANGARSRGKFDRVRAKCGRFRASVSRIWLMPGQSWSKPAKVCRSWTACSPTPGPPWPRNSDFARILKISPELNVSKKRDFEGHELAQSLFDKFSSLASARTRKFLASRDQPLGRRWGVAGAPPGHCSGVRAAPRATPGSWLSGDIAGAPLGHG